MCPAGSRVQRQRAGLDAQRAHQLLLGVRPGVSARRPAGGLGQQRHGALRVLEVRSARAHHLEREGIPDAVGHREDVVVAEPVPAPARGHREQVAHRDRAVRAVGLGDQRADGVVGADQALLHRSPEQHRGDRLGHRPALVLPRAVHRRLAVLAHEAAAPVHAHGEAELRGAVVHRVLQLGRVHAGLGGRGALPVRFRLGTRLGRERGRGAAGERAGGTATAVEMIRLERIRLPPGAQATASGLEQPPLDGPRRQLVAAGELELAQHRCHVSDGRSCLLGMIPRA